MNGEKSPEGQVETALEGALKLREGSAYDRNLELLGLAGGLKRVTLRLTDLEHERLLSRCDEGTLEGLLESFVADLTRSDRSIWEHCRDEARQWHAAHCRGERVARAYFNSVDKEGGQS